MTVIEFRRLGGEDWSQSFSVKMGFRAAKLYAEIYGKKAKQVRASTMPGWRNKIGKYPCGVLEQAYRQLKAEGHSSERGPKVAKAKPLWLGGSTYPD